ncbi:hypothetical protein GCM10009416_38680 [Craurococcus roseus]|uniref:Uncharacterized protein n=1 Tax=Craurococcus roseus TaxID=77585 RepID=A0ABP3QZL0_9PROT
MSGGKGPRASIPIARSVATAGATMARSSVPSVPPSPACGLSPATARRGAPIPKSRRNAAAVVLAASTIRAGVNRAMARASGSWTVTGTTRNCGQASSITGGTPGRPASSARYSVWPGWAKPAA